MKLTLTSIAALLILQANGLPAPKPVPAELEVSK